MKKEFDDIADVDTFIQPLLDAGKYSVFVIQNLSGKFVVEWQEHKHYTAQDGQTFPDEVWITREGEMKFIQDLEPEHVRNVLRRMLRTRRQTEEMMASMEAVIAEAVGNMGGESSEDETAPPGSMLH
jgi:hypothetical protein